ncbi:MAG: diacylglycerol kinase family lipid kinase [Blastocatellia bacterium]|nr:diacylglycerol kinase family lipid kinase [Blastocatellia bacterium]
MTNRFLAVVNTAAGHGRCGKMAGEALEKLRAAGVEIDVRETHRPGHATEIAREAYEQGRRHFLAVGGDGTSYEIINGLFPEALQYPDREGGDNQSTDEGERPRLAFLPLGTGNSFLRDFTDRGAEYSTRAIIEGRSRPCDVLRMTHREGVIHYINLLSIGFVADVAVVANRKFKRLGEAGYLLGILSCLASFNRRAFPMRIDGAEEMDRRPCLLLTFNNSKFTGGKMMIAPDAEIGDGLIEIVRWGPIGRMGLLRNLPGLYDGTHVNHPLAERKAARRVDFQLDSPIDIMVDGEVLTIHCETLEVLPSAIDVMV